jgi:formylmethanofuran dehydrogenase subunit A
MKAHSHVTMDMGQIIFTDTTTMTADGPFQYTLYTLSGNKWINHDVETETSAGIVPFHYRPKSAVHATQWSIGLELALLIKDPWKMVLSTDHPNAGPFIAYPMIIAWLMSRKAREENFKKLHKRAQKKSLLPSIDREMSLYEIAIMTRAGQARALGLKNKGHLGIGADADIAIYNINPENLDPSRDYEAIICAFRNAAYTIKSGDLVVKNGKVLKHVPGATLWVNVQLCKPCEIEVDADMKRKFKEYWTVEYENYPVSEGYLAISSPINVEADV